MLLRDEGRGSDIYIKSYLGRPRFLSSPSTTQSRILIGQGPLYKLTWALLLLLINRKRKEQHVQRRRTTSKNRGEASHCGTLPGQTVSRAFFGGAHSTQAPTTRDAQDVYGCAKISPDARTLLNDTSTFWIALTFFLMCEHFFMIHEPFLVYANISPEA
jgi:hypothetical protein